MTRGTTAYLTDDERMERRVAHAVVTAAIRTGALVRGTCERTAPQHRGLIAAHHRNGYANALDVTWLCAMHHGMEHYAMTYDRRMDAYESRVRARQRAEATA
jgi:hypothetical protein